jgi:ATP-dependent DNA helicase RecG
VLTRPKLKAASPFSFPVSPALAAKLAKLGLTRDADLVLHLPLRWEDETRLTPIRDLLPGQTAQVQAVVREANVAYRPRRMLTVTVEDAGGVLGIRFLNFYPSHLKLFQPGASFRFIGEVRGGFLGLEMVHPRFAKADDATPLPAQLTPVYPTTAGLGQATLRRAVERALVAPIPDTLPAEWLAELGLPELEASIRLLHQPPLECAMAELESRRHPAWQRLAFDELLAQQLSLATARRQRKSRPTQPLPPREQLTAAFTRALPFALTAAQARAWQEISADLAQPHPMRRLLQGDVGSGKTVVAALACLQAIENGFQAAFMAPTEILAEQHYRKLAPLLSDLGVRCAWVSGSQRKAERSAAWQAIAAGEADLAFGTHALFQEAGSFARLGLAVVDEQHRFGVGQRLALMQKGTEPHQLMMSATPIPRTLAMSFFADLDVSVIDELPPGRTPIVTKLVSAARRDDVLARVRDACLAGGQAYWVCPLIEESEKLQLQTAQDTYANADRTAARTAHRPGARTPEAGRKAGGDGGVPGARNRPAGGHHRHRGRRRRAQRLADGDRARRTHGARPAASAARARRPRQPRIGVRAAVRDTVVGTRPRAAEGHFRAHRRLRDRAPGPAAARPRRTARPPPERPADAALRRSRARCRAAGSSATWNAGSASAIALSSI